MKNIIFTFIINLCLVGSAQAKDCLFQSSKGLCEALPHSFFYYMENQNEIWKDVVGYEGLYQVSTLGRVKSCERFVKGRYSAMRIVKEIILRQKTRDGGYKEVSLWRNNKGDSFLVHILVGKAFISNPHNKPEINHIDTNPSNNVLGNLEWNTRKENAIHAVTFGSLGKGEIHYRTKLKNSEVSEILKFRKANSALTARQFQQAYCPQIPLTTLRHILGGYTWKHINRTLI